MSIDRWMDKEVVVLVHNGILISHKKEQISVSSNEVDEPRTYYTEWSQSERLISYTNACTQNLEKWYWEFICRQQWKNRHRERTYGHRGRSSSCFLTPPPKLWEPAWQTRNCDNCPKQEQLNKVSCDSIKVHLFTILMNLWVCEENEPGLQKQYGF